MRQKNFHILRKPITPVILMAILIIGYLAMRLISTNSNETAPLMPSATFVPTHISPTQTSSPVINNNPSTESCAQPAMFGYEILAEYPHDPTSFTQGLVYSGGYLYESTGRYGSSTIRKVDLLSGNVLSEYRLADDIFAEGLALVDQKAFQLSWKNNIGFVYDIETLLPISTFHYSTEGWGLTYDGNALIMSDGSSSLYFLDPQQFSIVRTLSVFDKNQPVSRLNELEYIQNEIFANIWQTDRIARIDPETGCVLAWIDLEEILDPLKYEMPVDVLNGIAYDSSSQRLFVTGKLWPSLFEIQLIPLMN